MPSVPNFSCIMGFTNRQPKVLSNISASRPKGLLALLITHGLRVICSTPPVMNTSPAFAAMACAACIAALMPEAHSRFTVSPGTLTGSPASKAAIRATFRLSSPAWPAQPSTTSSMAARSRSGCRPTNERITCAARSSARTGERPPPKTPIGVRMASTMYASFMVQSSGLARK
jgi:hypothetical protein